MHLITALTAATPLAGLASVRQPGADATQRRFEGTYRTVPRAGTNRLSNQRRAARGALLSMGGVDRIHMQRDRRGSEAAAPQATACGRPALDRTQQNVR